MVAKKIKQPTFYSTYLVYSHLLKRSVKFKLGPTILLWNCAII